MTVPSQAGVFGFAAQTAKVGDGTFTPGSYTWHRLRVQRVGFGTNQLNEIFPLEVGGAITPTGAYKRGMFVGGDVDIIPRLEDIQGLLFYALLGDVSSVTGKDMDGVSVSNVNTHIFRHSQSNSYYQPWLAVRRMTPGTTAADNWGESGYDCKLGNARINIPASGKITMRQQIVGRKVLFEENPSWTWENTFEDSNSTPESCTGSLDLGPDGPPCLGATIDIVNGLTTPQQEMIVGSHFPDDFVALTRSVTIRIITKWANPDLLQKALTGSAGGTTWDSDPYRTQTSGPTWAFKAEFFAPTQIPTSSPARDFGIQFRANDVVWMPDGVPELQAGGFVTQAFVGTVLQPSAGDYFQLVVQNGQTEYVWE